MKRLCIIIINYRTVELTLNCIATLVPQLDPSKDLIVVVDNNSGGNDVERLSAEIEQQDLLGLVTLIHSPVNGGFSAGNNIGIQSTLAHYYLLANSDTLFREDAIGELLTAIEMLPQASIISPRLEWPDEEPQISCFRFHTPVSELINSASTGLITSVLKRFDVPLDVQNNVTWPQWTSFACVLIKKEVFDKIGWLDEEYFMYYEDVDFCRSAAYSGFKLANWPTANVVHLRGKSSGLKKRQKEKKRLPDFYYQSRARYFTKFYGRTGFWTANLCWTVGRFVSFIKEFLLRREKGVPQKQYIDIWKK